MARSERITTSLCETLEIMLFGRKFKGRIPSLEPHNVQRLRMAARQI